MFDKDNNVKYIFDMDCREKKSVGRGEHHRVKGGYRKNKTMLTQDTLTTKQLHKMNGDVNCMNMNRPIDFESFIKFSDATKVDYLNNIIEEYNHSISDLCKMFCKQRNIVIAELNRIGVNIPNKRGMPSREHTNRWMTFIYPPQSDYQIEVVSGVETTSGEEVEIAPVVEKAPAITVGDISLSFTGGIDVFKLEKLIELYNIDSTNCEFTITIKPKRI